MRFGERARLPDRRYSLTESIAFQGEKYHLTMGFYDDTFTRIGEVFLVRVKDRSASKLGTTLEAMCRDAAIIVSLALQYGTPLKVLQEAMTRDDEGLSQTILATVIDELIRRAPSQS